MSVIADDLIETLTSHPPEKVLLLGEAGVRPDSNEMPYTMN